MADEDEGEDESCVNWNVVGRVSLWKLMMRGVNLCCAMVTEE